MSNSAYRLFIGVDGNSTSLDGALPQAEGGRTHASTDAAPLSKYGDYPNAPQAISMMAQPGDFDTLASGIMAGVRVADLWGQSIIEKGAAHVMRCLARLGFLSGNTLCLTGDVKSHYADYLLDWFLSKCVRPYGSALEEAFQHAKKIGLP